MKHKYFSLIVNGLSCQRGGNGEVVGRGVWVRERAELSADAGRTQYSSNRCSRPWPSHPNASLRHRSMQNYVTILPTRGRK